MKKRTALCAFLLIVLCLLPHSAIAHSGGTDSNGGHMDHGADEYHYHHGKPAHDHWDMDGDGTLDCPYDLSKRLQGDGWNRFVLMVAASALIFLTIPICVMLFCLVTNKELYNDSIWCIVFSNCLVMYIILTESKTEQGVDGTLAVAIIWLIVSYFLLKKTCTR